MVLGKGENARLQNRFGGAVTITPVQNDTQYHITYQKIPQEKCIDWTSKMAGGSSQSAFLGFSVTGPAPATLPETPDHLPPVAIQTVTTLCTSKSDNTMSFFYR
ncbi:MAG: hypothetical protein Alpg2KO_10600 [Alphaproteobacteria bacterium]